MKIRLKNQSVESGFNAIEFLVGTAVVMIVSVSLYAGIASTFTTMGSARDRLRATQILLERVEGLRLYRWEDQLGNTALMPLSFTNYYYEFAADTESKGIPYIGTVTITDADLSPSATYTDLMRKIVVSVSWISSGISNYNSLTTYASRDGIQNYVYSDSD
jgi:Tfp pilus assembly protein PilV